VADVLRGLHAAHELKNEQGMPLDLVHRDVSPHNILVGLDGVSKIADFGVAKAVGTLEASGRVGKRAYMVPEQLAREPVDRRCDVYAARVVLRDLLRGSGHDGLAAIARRATSKNPEDRYTTADAMADAIEHEASPPGSRSRPSRWRRGSPAWWAIDCRGGARTRSASSSSRSSRG
jgi:serine/threonine protein kinase